MNLLFKGKKRENDIKPNVAAFERCVASVEGKLVVSALVPVRSAFFPPCG